MLETMARIGRRSPVAGRIAGLAVVLAVTGFGCAARGEGSPFVSPQNARINIEIINHGFQDVTLHAVWPGQRVRLGFVTGTKTVNFLLPWARSELLQIEIDLLAGPECITRPMWADPGDIILVEITNQIMNDPDCIPGRRRGS